MPQYHEVVDEADEFIWGKIIENEGVEFHTARGMPFTYTIKRNAAGEQLGEIIIDRRSGKTITRGTVLLAYKKALELDGVVTGPKKLGVFGASYIYPIFVEVGIERKEKNMKITGFNPDYVPVTFAEMLKSLQRYEAQKPLKIKDFSVEIEGKARMRDVYWD